MGLRPAQGDENRVEEGSVGNYTYLCHLDRSEAEWSDLRFPTSGAKSAPDMGHPDLLQGSRNKGRSGRFYQLHFSVALSVEHLHIALNVAKDEYFPVAKLGFLYRLFKRHRPQRY